MKRDPHKIRILKLLLKRGRLTASQVTFISNSNQYFTELESVGVVGSEWAMLGDSKVKFRFISDEKKALEMIESAGKSRNGGRTSRNDSDRENDTKLSATA